MPQSNESTSDLDAAISCASDMVRDHPTTSMLLVFGLGLAAGLAVVESMQKAAGEGHAADSAVERLGHQIGEAIKGALPDALRRQLAL